MKKGFVWSTWAIASIGIAGCQASVGEQSTSEDQASGASPSHPPLTPDQVWDALQHPKMHAAYGTSGVDTTVLDSFPDDPADLEDGTIDADSSSGMSPQAQYAGKVDDVDLRNQDQVLNQGPVGSCTAHAVAGAMNVALDVRLNGQSRQISAQDLWYLQGRQPNLVTSIQTAEQYWIVTADVWPNQANSSPVSNLAAGSYAAIAGASQLSSLQAVVDALRASRPVVVASKLLDSWRAERMRSDGIIDADATASSWQHAYHAYALVGFHIDTQGRFQDWNGGYVIVKNSWGSHWGDQGYAYMPFNYCSKMRARYSDGYCNFYSLDSVITKSGQ